MSGVGMVGSMGVRSTAVRMAPARVRAVRQPAGRRSVTRCGSISTADFKNGLTILMDGEVYRIVDFQHVKPGKGSAFVRSKLKKLTGSNAGGNLEKTWRAGEKTETAELERINVQHTFKDADEFVFMDLESYEEKRISEEDMGDSVNYVLPDMQVQVTMYKGKPIGVDLPTTVDLTVADTDPGVKGNTASGGNKPATMETGLVVTVPLHINIGDVLSINTQTGEYSSKVA